jgi:hypothetical protein
MRLRRRVAALLLALAVVAGCGSSPGPTPVATGTASPGAASATPVGQTSVPTATAAPGEPTPTPQTVPGEIELGPGPFDLVDPRAGLDGLSSYTETLSLAFDGTRDGQAVQWTKTLTFRHTVEPDISMLTVETTGDAVASEPDVLAEATGALYQHHADGSCSGQPLDADITIALHEPAGLLPGLLGAEETGQETMNAVPANRYSFDQRALAESGRTESAGEVWVAVEGGYVVRFVRTTQADASYFGDGLVGSMTWTYDLTQIDQPLDIRLPDGCRVDAPIMADAENVLNLPEALGYDTPSSVNDVTAFYREELPKDGWETTGDPLDGEAGTLTRFTKGDEVLNVIVNTGDSGTRVDVIMSTAE